jgi:hypothetical protein
VDSLLSACPSDEQDAEPAPDEQAVVASSHGVVADLIAVQDDKQVGSPDFACARKDYWQDAVPVRVVLFAAGLRYAQAALDGLSDVVPYKAVAPLRSAWQEHPYASWNAAKKEPGHV